MPIAHTLLMALDGYELSVMAFFDHLDCSTEEAACCLALLKEAKLQLCFSLRSLKQEASQYPDVGTSCNDIPPMPLLQMIKTEIMRLV